jgi:hypothetical protein
VGSDQNGSQATIESFIVIKEIRVGWLVIGCDRIAFASRSRRNRTALVRSGEKATKLAKNNQSDVFLWSGSRARNSARLTGLGWIRFGIIALSGADSRCRVATPESNALPDSPRLSGLSTGGDSPKTPKNNVFPLLLCQVNNVPKW